MTESTYTQSVQNCVKRCRRVARTALAIVTVFWILFAIFSGAEGPGLNTGPGTFNAILPWLVIALLWFVAWKWEIPGGLLIIAFSIFMAVRLDIFSGNSTEALMIITPLVMTGFMFIFIGLRILAAKRADATRSSA